MDRIWNPQAECMDAQQLRDLQSQRLCDAVRRVYDAVPYYRRHMDEAGIKPQDIRGVEDLKLLPFTTKADLRDNYPFGTFAVPMKRVVRVHASSGTTGKPTVVGYTQQDIDMWSECMARSLTAAGASDEDIVHVAYGYGLFTGGLGAHYGAERIGASVVPVSGGNTNRQLQLLEDFGATVLCCTPSYALHLADQMAVQGIDKGRLRLKCGVHGAEPWTDEMRREIEERLGYKAYDIYGLSEILGPGVSISCAADCGMHIQADHFIPEIIDPDSGEVLPDGARGELVFTCITKQALPLIRYRTRDLTMLSGARCACGRTLPRMQKVTGRSDDMLVIRGVNVFPSQIESVLLRFDVAPHYMIYVDRVNNLDALEVHVEMTPQWFSDQVRNIEILENRLRHEVQSVLGVGIAVRLVEPHTIERSEGKAKRVIDRRGLFDK